MSQVSKRIIDPRVLNSLEEMFLDSILSCSTLQTTRDYLNDILTPTEKIMLAKRLSIAYLLLKGHDYRTIRSIVKVSTPTIGVVSRILKLQGNGLRSILSQFHKKREIKKILTELCEAALIILESGKGGNWKHAGQIKYKRKLLNHQPL